MFLHCLSDSSSTRSAREGDSNEDAMRKGAWQSHLLFILILLVAIPALLAQQTEFQNNWATSVAPAEQTLSQARYIQHIYLAH